MPPPRAWPKPFATVVRTPARAFALAMLALGASCGGDDDDAAAKDASISLGPDSLRFEGQGALDVKPGARLEITLVGPRVREPVRVWLDGDYLDATLDRDVLELMTGSAKFALIAPNLPTTFEVRARLGEASTRLTVSVGSSGFAELRVHPKYEGPREGRNVVATLSVSELSCDKLLSRPIDEIGKTRAEGPLGTALVLPNAPAAQALAVIARIEHYAIGCEQVEPVPAGTSADIELKIFDRPLDLSPTFDATLDVEPDDKELAAWKATVMPFATEWVDAFVGASGANEADWLLDAMTTAAAAARVGAGAELQSARSAGGWDNKTKTWLEGHAPTIRARALAYVQSGVERPPTPLAIQVSPGAATQGKVVPVTLGGRDATGWLTAPAPFDWSGDASDVLRLSGAFSIKPGALLGRAADAGAVTTGAAGFANGLTTGIDCGGLSQTLVGSGESYAGCDVACTTQLCGQAIALRAAGAATKVDADYTPLSLAITSASAPAVGSKTEVFSFEGSWSGTVQGVASPFGLHGKLTGKPH